TADRGSSGPCRGLPRCATNRLAATAQVAPRAAAVATVRVAPRTGWPLPLPQGGTLPSRPPLRRPPGSVATALGVAVDANREGLRGVQRQFTVDCGAEARVEGFGAATREWFEGAFRAPTEVQQRGWRRIA